MGRVTLSQYLVQQQREHKEIATDLAALIEVVARSCKAISAAIGEGALAGILFRNAEAIERMRDIDTVVVDKTGTLTLGRPALTDFEVNGIARDEGLRLIASAEQPSEHPIAHAIVTAAREAGVALSSAQDFNAHNGLGVEAQIDGRHVLVHNADSFVDDDLAALVDGWTGEQPRLLVRREPHPSDFGHLKFLGISLLPARIAATLPDEPCGLYSLAWKPAYDAGLLETVEAHRHVDRLRHRRGLPAGQPARVGRGERGRPDRGRRGLDHPLRDLAGRAGRGGRGAGRGDPFAARDGRCSADRLRAAPNAPHGRTGVPTLGSTRRGTARGRRRG